MSGEGEVTLTLPLTLTMCRPTWLRRTNTSTVDGQPKEPRVRVRVRGRVRVRVRAWFRARVSQAQKASSSSGRPVSVKSPAWIRQSPAGSGCFGALLCVSLTQTNRTVPGGCGPGCWSGPSGSGRASSLTLSTWWYGRRLADQWRGWWRQQQRRERRRRGRTSRWRRR